MGNNGKEVRWLDQEAYQFEKKFREDKARELGPLNNIVPGSESNNLSTFRIIFKDRLYDKGDILDVSHMGCKLKVLQKPYKKWYRRLLKFISFGYFDAPYGYKVKVI